MAEKLYAKKEALEKPALGGSAADVLLFFIARGSSPERNL